MNSKYDQLDLLEYLSGLQEEEPAGIYLNGLGEPLPWEEEYYQGLSRGGD